MNVIGLSKRRMSEINEDHDAPLRGQYQDLIQQFPDKADRLLAVTTRVRSALA